MEISLEYLLIVEGSLMKKINVSFIVYFHLGKYSSNLITFLTHLIFGKKLTFYSLFISTLVNTASISVHFQHISYFEQE